MTPAEPRVLRSRLRVWTRWIAFAQFRRPATGRLQGRQPSPFPSPAVSVPRPAAGRQFGLRQPPDPHKEGTKDERLSTRS
jgi:hypothetical protein